MIYLYRGTIAYCVSVHNTYSKNITKKNYGMRGLNKIPGWLLPPYATSFYVYDNNKNQRNGFSIFI